MSPAQFAMLMADWARRIEDEPLEMPLRHCLPVLHQGFENNFMRAEFPDGSPWPPHAPSTLAKMGPHPLLIWHGHLIEAVRDTGHPGNIHDVEDDGRTLVTGVMTSVVEYAAVHQFGGGNNIPPRTYVYATDAVVDQCADVFAQHAFEHLFVSD